MNFIKVAHYIREKFLKTARYDLIMKDMMIYNNHACEKGGKYEIWVQKTWFSKISRTKYEQKSLADSNSGPAVCQTNALPTELWSYTIEVIETSYFANYLNRHLVTLWYKEQKL